MKLRHTLLAAFVVAGCSTTPIAPPVAPASAAPSPSPSPSTEAQLSIYLAAPDGHTVQVGSDLRLNATNTRNKPITWRISDEDKDKATVQTSIDPKLGSVATVRAVKPGGVHVIAEVDGKPAEALIASLDRATTSSPIPMPSGYPLQSSSSLAGARLIADNAAWNSFVGEIRQGTASTGGLEPPPIDFATRSLIAVVADALPNTGAPVVTHIGSGTVEVVHPRIIGYFVPEPGGYPPGIITLLVIPKVSSDTKVNFRPLSRTNL